MKEELLGIQDFTCPICFRDFRKMKSRDICLDHNHENGRIRWVLCRPCNSLEGKYKRYFIRVGHRNNKVDYKEFLVNLSKYYDMGEQNFIHPTYGKKRKKCKKKK